MHRKQNFDWGALAINPTYKEHFYKFSVIVHSSVIHIDKSSVAMIFMNMSEHIMV